MDGSRDQGIRADAELAEIDRRLALLRRELAAGEAGAQGPAGGDFPGAAAPPGEGPASSAPPNDSAASSPPPNDSAASSPQPGDGPEALGQRGRSSGPLARALARDRPPSRPEPVELHAGPFADPEAVRAFARLLGELRAVAQVRLAGYEGADRAILEVTLAEEEAARRGGAQSA